jgi:heme/copper-type cytochrome/quinol oxidase subunit 3
MATTLPATREDESLAPATVADDAGPVVEPFVQRWGPVTVGAALAAGAQLMLYAGLVGGFLLLRSDSHRWPPQGIHLDNYRGTTVVFTVLLLSGMAQWAVHAVRHDDQRNTVVGLAMALGLTAAAGDLAWFTLARIGFPAGATAYGTFVYAMLGVFIALAVGTAVALLVALVRAIGGQAGPGDHQPVTAATIQAHTLTVVWLSVYLAVWIRK